MTGIHNKYNIFFDRIMELTVLIILLFTTSSVSAQVIQEDPAQLRGIDVVEHLNENIPLDILFTDDKGQQTSLGAYFRDDKPVILIMGYYTCPMLCNLVFNGVTKAMKDSDWLIGREYKILTASIDPTETDLIAAAKKKNYVTELGRYESEDGWTFLTGDSAASKKLADAVGFQYFYDEKIGQYAHPAVIIVISPKGKISRYFYGIEFKERDIRLALMDAADGKVGDTIDRLLLYCYHYDPEAGSYVAIAGNIMKIGGLLTLIIFGLFLSSLWIKELIKRRRMIAPGRS